MGIQYETVTVQIGGANAQTLTVKVPVDTTTGAGSTSITYSGANGGSDSLQATATIAGTNLTSNTASVNWQQSNGNIQIGSIVNGYAWNDSPTSGPVAMYLWRNPNDTGATGAYPRTIADATATQTNNSLIFDVQGATDATAPYWNTLNSAGTYTSGITFPPYGSNFNAIFSGFLLVPTAGTFSVTITYKDGVIWGIGSSASGASPTWSGKGSIVAPGSQTMTVIGGYPLLPAAQNNGDSGYYGTSTVSVTFPLSGVYPIEVGWDYWYHNGRILHVYPGSSDFAPVTLISAPPSSTPTGNLTITPAGGSTNLQVVGQAITLSVNVSGIVYPTIPYIPVLEGTTGTLYLYNDPTNPTFTFQTYNGQTVDKTAAAASVFTLTSTDNTAYQGLMSVGFDGTNFSLNYNGSTANPTAASRVQSTGLVIEAEDIAWYNSTAKTFDLFPVASAKGGTAYSIEIDYMNKPSVSSISPTTITAMGGSYTCSISLNKAFSPIQLGADNTGNTINVTCSITGATSTGTPVPTYDANNWLTGWTVPFTAPTATTNQTLSVNLTVSGNLTYLSGNTFTTGTVTYINGVVGTITASGSTYVPPQAQSFSTSPVGPSFGTTTSVTATATLFVTGSNDSVTCSFFAQASSGTAKTTIGSGVLQSSSAATYNGASGYVQTYTITFNPQLYSTPTYFGYTATDNVSGLTATYTSSSEYSYTTTTGNSGGSTGCPTLDMFVLDGIQVKDVVIGTELDAINVFPATEGVKLPVLAMNIGEEVCYRFETENGAVVIVSESTPIPTIETTTRAIYEDHATLPFLPKDIRSGMHVLTNIDGTLEISMLVETVCIGVRQVARLYIGGKNFAAGEDARKRIYTHNTSMRLPGTVK